MFPDMESLHDHLSNQDKCHQDWQQVQQHLSLSLTQEVLMYEDVTLIDVLDTYRNIPKKLLHFFQW